MNMKVMEIVRKVGEEIFNRNERILIVWHDGNSYYVLASNFDGRPSFHPPYVVNKDGKIESMLHMDEDKRKEFLDKCDIVYENKLLEERRENTNPQF